MQKTTTNLLIMTIFFVMHGEVHYNKLQMSDDLNNYKDMGATDGTVWVVKITPLSSCFYMSVSSLNICSLLVIH